MQNTNGCKFCRRMGCSKQGANIHCNIHKINDPSCIQGDPCEDVQHYSLEYQNYIAIRQKLYNPVSLYTDVDL